LGLRCEPEAAFVHLYVPADKSHDWRPAEGRTADDLAVVHATLPTPRDVVAYVVATSLIVERKIEEKYDSGYRTEFFILKVTGTAAGSVPSAQLDQICFDPSPAELQFCHLPRYR
jgi:hypothetical protein